MKLRHKMVVVLFTAAVLPALIIILAYQTKIYKTLEQNFQEYVNERSYESVTSINQHFEDIENLLFNVRTQSSLIEFLKQVDYTNYSEMQNQLRTSQIGEKLEFILSSHSDMNHIGIIPAQDGIKICRGYYSYVNNYCTSLEYVQSVAQSPKQIYCEIVYDEVKQKPYLCFLTCIMDSYKNDILGYLSVVMDATHYFDMLADAEEERHFVVTDHKGEAVYTHRISLTAEQLSALDYGNGISTSTITNHNIDYSAITRKLDYVPWHITYFADMSSIQNSLLETSIFMLRLVIVFIVFALASILYFRNRIYEPIQTLTDKLNHTDKNLLDIQTTSGTDEIGQLGSAFNHLIERIKDQIAEIEAAERSKAELQIKALQAQINPHFMYNTLNAIKCLARMGRTSDISAMVEALIDLLRISAGKERLIPISREVEYVRAYAALMSLRAGYEITIVSDIAPEIEAAELPKLTLQPIVENCIIHGGIEAHDGRLLITISASRNEDEIRIGVSDDGCGMTADKILEINSEKPEQDDNKTQFSGIGINNVRQRMRLEYGKDASVTVHQNATGGTTVQLCFRPKAKSV